MEDEEEFLINKAEKEWEKQEEAEKEFKAHEHYLESLTNEDVDDLIEEDKQRTNQNRVRRENRLKEEKELSLWKDDNPNEADIWNDRWCAKLHNSSFLIDKPGRNEFKEWKAWIGERYLFTQVKQSKEWQIWKENQDGEDNISRFLAWSVWRNVDETHKYFAIWKEDHLKEWSSYTNEFIHLGKEDNDYEFFAWKEYFYWADVYELWATEHNDEWSAWKKQYGHRFQVEIGQYALFDNWKRVNSFLWDEWTKAHIGEVEKWKANDSAEITEVSKTYVEKIRTRKITQLRMKSRRTRDRPFDDDYYGLDDVWTKWKDSFPNNLKNVLEQFKDAASLKLETGWRNCFNSYEKTKNYLENDFWVKTHLSEAEKNESLASEYNACKKEWEIYLNSLDSFWKAKELELDKGVSESRARAYEMKLFSLWKDDHLQQWNNWYYRFLWEEKWQPVNRQNFNEWRSENLESRFFELWKKQNSALWNDWIKSNWDNWKIKVTDLDIWKTWVIEHPDKWAVWAEKNLVDWREWLIIMKNLDFFDIWNRDHIGSVDDFKQWQEEKSENWEIWEKEFQDNILKKKWEEG